MSLVECSIPLCELQSTDAVDSPNTGETRRLEMRRLRSVYSKMVNGCTLAVYREEEELEDG